MVFREHVFPILILIFENFEKFKGRLQSEDEDEDLGGSGEPDGSGTSVSGFTSPPRPRTPTLGGISGLNQKSPSVPSVHENDEDQDIPDDDASPDPVIDEPETEEAEPEKQAVAPLPATAAQQPTAAAVAAATAPNKEAVTLDESMALLEKLQKQVSKDPNNAQVTASNKDEGYVR